jgi:hypothetical protein
MQKRLCYSYYALNAENVHQEAQKHPKYTAKQVEEAYLLGIGLYIYIYIYIYII